MYGDEVLRFTALHLPLKTLESTGWLYLDLKMSLQEREVTINCCRTARHDDGPPRVQYYHTVITVIG
jgi:hypothetical protein